MFADWWNSGYYSEFQMVFAAREFAAPYYADDGPSAAANSHGSWFSSAKPGHVRQCKI